MIVLNFSHQFTKELLAGKIKCLTDTYHTEETEKTKKKYVSHRVCREHREKHIYFKQTKNTL
jgi:hypothetical protein